jgi:uncharacterized protein (TIRG00374 family)
MAAKTHVRQWARAIGGILVSAAALGILFARVDREELLAVLRTASVPWIGAGIASLGVGYAVRIRRWAVILGEGGKGPGAAACAAPFLGSIAINNLIPLRAGDFVRALVFPPAVGVSRTNGTASLILERFLDFLMVLVLLAIAVVFGARDELLPLSGTGAVALAAAATACAVCFHSLGRVIGGLAARLSVFGEIGNRFAHLVQELVRSFDRAARPAVLGELLALSTLAWLAEAGLYWAVAIALGAGIGPLGALCVCALATIATLIPSAPGYVGTFHLAAYAAVYGLTRDSSLAFSFALVSHAAFWLPTTAVGSWLMVRNPGLFRLRQR